MNILITGATGFVGGAVVKRFFSDKKYIVYAAVRHVSEELPEKVAQICVGDLTGNTNYSEALKGMDCVIHCAARVHVMNDDVSDPLEEFRRVNVEGTLNLARQAAKAGVKRFVFISSIKVNGEGTFDIPFSPDDSYIPTDPYGLSKWEAEQALCALAEESGLEVVIIRPPLIYGPGVKANFQSMIQWLKKGVPLPFGAIHNQRSMVALDNLVDFIALCIYHPKAANQTFLISDGEDVSTTELLRKVAKAFDKKSRLIPVPVSLMRFAAGLFGKQAMADRLFGSLQVDSSKGRNLLGWKPVISMDEQLKKTVKSYK